MAGSLRKRPELGADAWELRVFLGRDNRGRVRHKSRTFRGSKRAAEKELARPRRGPGLRARGPERTRSPLPGELTTTDQRRHRGLETERLG